jgi:AcrR family transcriptional regulator
MPKLSDAALEERRRHILRAAELCFARSGFRNTTIADVKREAGVSTGAIYTYFRSKEAMIRAILEAARDDRRQQLMNAMSASGPVAQALVLFEWTMAIFNAQGQHSARLNVNLWAEALRSPRIGKLARDALEEATQAVSAVVAARLEATGAAGAFDANAAASLMIAIFLGLEVQTAVGMRVELPDIVQVLAKFFAEYLPDEAAKPRATTAKAKKKRNKSEPRRRRTRTVHGDEDTVPPSAVTQRERS